MMTNEDFIARTRIELSTILQKIDRHVDEIRREDRGHPDARRIRIALGALDTVIELLECDDARDINIVAEEFDAVSEDCAYLAEDLANQ